MPTDTAAILQIETPSIRAIQSVLKSETYAPPNVELQPFRDFYGNPCRRAILPAGDVQVAYDALVELPDLHAPSSPAGETDILTLPADVILYLLPSRYCPSDRFGELARAEFGGAAHGCARVRAICSWINRNIAYEYGASTTTTSAFETVIERRGVCRDFAHLAISFCRALNIPARYASGYCLGLKPPDFHAYFQAYLDGQWITFDATAAQPREALITAAVGRDAADCAWCSFFGDGETKGLEVNVARGETRKSEPAHPPSDAAEAL